jgi:hypothetical protein
MEGKLFSYEKAKQPQLGSDCYVYSILATQTQACGYMLGQTTSLVEATHWILY